MRTVIDVIKALSGMIETITGSPPTTKDVTEGFDRPCTWIRPLSIDPEAVRGLQRDYLEMEIVYFAPRSWDGWNTLLHVQAALTAALREPVAVSETFAIYPEDLEFVPSREDMTLVCTFNLENYQLLPPEDGTMPAMEDLELETRDPDGTLYDSSEAMEDLDLTGSDDDNNT